MPKENRPIIIERDGGSSLWWFLLGGALGAGLALLFAPHSGDRTRQLVGRKLNKLRDAADVALEDLRDALSPAPEERVHRSQAESEPVLEAEEAVDAAESVEEVAAPRRKGGAGGQHSAASARHELERRLAEARARRHRSLADEDEEPVA